MSNNKVLRKQKITRNGAPYWIVLEDRINGTQYVAGFSVEWHITDPSFSGENLGPADEFDAIVERMSDKPKEDKKEDAKKGKSKSSDSGSRLNFFQKLILTVCLVLPIVWLCKLAIAILWYPINVLLWPFRFVCGSCMKDTSRDLFPDWKWPKYDM